MNLLTNRYHELLHEIIFSIGATASTRQRTMIHYSDEDQNQNQLLACLENLNAMTILTDRSGCKICSEKKIIVSYSKKVPCS